MCDEKRTGAGAWKGQHQRLHFPLRLYPLYRKPGVNHIYHIPKPFNHERLSRRRMHGKNGRVELSRKSLFKKTIFLKNYFLKNGREEVSLIYLPGHLSICLYHIQYVYMCVRARVCVLHIYKLI